MASTTRISLGIVSFVTMMIFIIALLKLEFVHDDIKSGGGGGSSSSSSKFFIQPSAYNKEAIALRLGLIRPEILSWSPRIIHFHNFLSFEECEYLIALAQPRLPNPNSKGFPNNVRTSDSMFLNPKEREYPIIEAIENRVSIYSQVPVENGESLQVIRYQKDQFYIPHNDYFSNKTYISRVATVLMYLSDVIEGGETYFPRAGSDNCSCGGEIVRGLSVKPVKGNAILFWSMGLNGKADPNSKHGGCKVVSGVKWSATKWMRQKPY